MEQLQRFRCEIVEFRSVCNRAGMEGLALILDNDRPTLAQVQIRRAVEALRKAHQVIAARQDVVLQCAAPAVRETLSMELFDGIEMGKERIVEQLRQLADCMGSHRLDPRDPEGARLAATELRRLINKELAADVKRAIRAIDECLSTSEVAETSLAFTDELTGLPNRRALYALADRMWEGARTREPFILARFDLDHFKQINDTHGHAAGDAALTRAAGIMQEMISADDFVARVGGEAA